MKCSVFVSALVVALTNTATYATGVISVNIALDGPKMSEQSGVAPGLSEVSDVAAASWNDITAGKGEGGPLALRAWDSASGGIVAPEGLEATWAFSGVWGTGSSPDLYRQRWINAAGAGAWSMSISGIPYEVYDIICYCNWDGSNGWSPVNVNGENWTCGEDGAGVKGSGYWGVTTSDLNEPAALGKNAMRIANLKGQTLALSGSGHCNVCAIQIVERQLIEFSGLITSKEISRLAKGASDVYLKAAPGAVIRLFDRVMNCKAVHIISEGSVLVETYDNMPPAEGSFVKENVDKLDASGLSGGCFVHTWEAPARTLSVNFGASTENGSYMPLNWGFYGALGPEEIPAISWNNVDFDNGAKTVSDFRPLLWDGVTAQTNVSAELWMSWNFGAYWRGGDMGKQEPFRGGFCSPGNGSWKVDIHDIPFEAYDLILYFSYDGGGVIDAVPVNGTCYRYDTNSCATVECRADAESWGSANLSCMSEFGKNALLITNLTDKTISLSRLENGHWHQPLCALQLIEHRPPLKKRLFGLAVTVR